MIATVEEAHNLLKRLGASDQLLLHLKLVGLAAAEILSSLECFDLDLDEDFVRIGAAIHDAGKIVYPNELENPGTQHESAGEKLLLEANVQPAIARCCLSHARYNVMAVSLEELLVALSDKLWRGKRDRQLELRVVDAIAEKLGRERWDIFCELDESFEEVASKGDGRLLLSMQY